MSIETEVNSMIDNIKKDYKAIENLGATIPEDKNIENIASCLEEVYDNLPKVSGEGTSITLTPTLKGKLNYENNIVGYGDTEQTQYSGINLLPENKYAATQTLNGITYTNNGDGTFNIVGTATANTSIQIIPRNEIALEQGQAYYLWCNTAYDITNFNFTIAMYDGSTSTKYLLANGTYTPTATPTDERLQFYIASGNSVNKTNIKCMLVKGSTAPTNYEPYVGGTASPNPDYPQDIEVVTGTQELTVENKNLLDYTKYVTISVYGVTATNNNDGSITLNGTASNTSFIITESSTNYMTLEPGTYTLSANNSVATGGTSGQNAIRLLKTDQTSVIGSSVCTMNTINATATFTLTETTDCFLQVRTQSGNTYTNFVIKPQLEYGSTATTYTPHQEQTQTISLGDIELCKIGNYQDYLYKSNDKWYKKEHIGKVVFNGSENWIKSNSRFHTAIPSANGNYVVGALCREYIEVSTHDIHANTNYSFIVCNSGWGVDHCRVSFNNSDYASVDDWKNALTTNNIIVYYQLTNELGGANDIEITNTTLIEQLDNLENLMSYNEQTNIEVDGDLPMIIKARAIKGE